MLRTEFTAATGRAVLTDFMPVDRLVDSRLGQSDAALHRVIRRLECVEGRLAFELVFRPTFDFARRSARLELTGDGATASIEGEALELSVAPPGALRIDGDRVVGRLDLSQGDLRWLTVAHRAPAVPPSGTDPARLLALALEHWREWDQGCTYRGPYEREVRGSARVLKMLSFAPTGALVAAPTTSLPEEIGGIRNWDYRFCWLRDAALVLSALADIGYHGTARDFFQWLDDLCPDDGCDDLQIMYRIDGGAELPEIELRHLSGYRDSRPVRIGNAAAGQRQLDVYGYVLDAALLSAGHLAPIRPGLWVVLRHLADQAAARWTETDHGIWEIRGEPRRFTSSMLMCWVALDRAIRLAEQAGLDGDTSAWRRERDAVRAFILEQCFDPAVGAFTQSPGWPALDASALLIPLVHFLPPDDPRVVRTVESIRRTLTANGLVYRYLNDDGLPGQEATFALCSFWMVDNLALQGRLDEARALFERVLGYASDLGLLSEEIDPINRQLIGNYPQGFTHLALIRSAVTLARAGQGTR